MVTRHESLGLALAFGFVYKSLPEDGPQEPVLEDAIPSVSSAGWGYQPCRQGMDDPAAGLTKQGFRG